MKIYLDNCCFNRPFDDQNQARSGSKIANPGGYTRQKIGPRMVLHFGSGKHGESFPREKTSYRTLEKHLDYVCKGKGPKAKEINQLGIRSKDALHLASAIFAGCQYFLTTDDKIINKNKLIAELTLTDPIGFIKEVYNDN